MAMLRFARILALHLVIVSAGAAGLCVRAEAAEPAVAGGRPKPPRAIMRLPAWIEAIGGHGERQPAAAQQQQADPSRPMLTGGWKELVDGKQPNADAPAAGQETASEATPPSQKLGPEASVLKEETEATEPTEIGRAHV